MSLGFALRAAEAGLRFAGYEPLYAVYSKPELFWRYGERLTPFMEEQLRALLWRRAAATP